MSTCGCTCHQGTHSLILQQHCWDCDPDIEAWEKRSFEAEKKALDGNVNAITWLVTAVRKYRDAAKMLKKARYTDGACDGVAVSSFLTQAEYAEYCLGAACNEDP